MSLTNPNKVITEERLSEFYQSIFPYLGGMPEILANKFNKSDLYSTSEKMIGQWTDGKPLYQKVIVKNIVGNGQWEEFDTSVSYDKLINCRVTNDTITNVQYNGFQLNCRFCLDSHKLRVYGATNVNIPNANVIIQYTKTTDSPVSIGNDTDYSTTEKIVGTWIDGKPLYQKVFDLGADTTIGKDVYPELTEWTNTNIDITNIGGFCMCRGIASAGTIFNINAAKIDNKLNLVMPGKAHNIRYVVLQYTKTTD